MKKFAQTKKDRVMVLVVGSVLQLFVGIIYVWSVFVGPVSEVFSWDIEGVKLTSSFMLCFFVLGILVGGKMQTKISSQRTTLLGGLMLVGGMLISGLLPRDMGYMLYVTYGVIGGLGVRLVYTCVITAAQRNFPKKRGLATGVSVCAFGFSTVIFAPLVESLVGTYGLQETFLILSAAFFIVVLACFMSIKLPKETAGAAAALEQRQYTTKEMLKTRAFYFITASMMFGVSLYFVLNPSFKTLAMDRGVTAEFATVMVIVTGIANAAGRLGIPALSEKVGREWAAFIALILTAVSGVALAFIGGDIMIVFFALTAFCYGGFSGVYPVITADRFGLKHVGANYGMVMLGFALSALLMPMAMNAIPGTETKFIVLSGIALVGGVLILLTKTSSKQVSEDVPRRAKSD